MPNIIESKSSPGAVIEAESAAMQLYMQRYPYLHGPDKNLNKQILQSLPKMIRVRQPGAGCTIERLSAGEAELNATTRAHARALFKKAGVAHAAVAEAFERLSWKFCDFPANVRSILDIGCGEGSELIFLRALAPNARIVAVDWVFESSSEILKTANIEFYKTDVFDFLESAGETFDVVFSNHVLEHLYQPDRMLRLLRKRVAQGGRMMAALPMDGEASCFPEALARLQEELPLRWPYFGSIDLGHPWKTTPADLRQSLLNAGFADSRFIQREQHLTLFLAVDERGLAKFRKRVGFFHAILLRPIKALMAMLFPDDVPFQVGRIFYALESRLWFGAGRLKNAEAPEILAIAD